ncbi:hypothetical protein A3D80_02705 [Candidatus Roizmanbacteria bacterium RIFCSPHIGHO2_02_FULL_40_13b]|uniref:Camelysin metallo-endopeptidase n=1 Tax=Candidatus Roizmanbacteria bacterium RIFCSPHIGHO2_01_FULL_39_24 TaxID=1802032 RepID=A0A1F7GGS4_9BACT|nr:MAG: hypothetical protein A2799_03130 [Candidatus Roizmanbacteria bacterium RIFCSPHIGHO2_01_FULL_39_24]OGK27188.1 MAG: hypothetical protein A3D80_02705 [Candidatus Roizmanbacteria bacterium RIFCSPHIGHO2_02_FULL_40_13b]OGK49515.1 MAG: hypothetical protein A3A56_02710 [Candidatus Roizmanbacteria bacterium RIFCSPLOWO2_01_FULL_40_32]
MNRQILFSLISIVSVVGMVGGSAFAMFSSTATNDGNTFGAGTLVLEIDGEPGSGSSQKFIVTDIAPGESETQMLALSNTGSIDATSVVLSSIGHTGSSPDLGDKLTLRMYDDNGTTVGVFDGGDTLRGTAHITDGAWSNISMGFGLLTGETHNVFAVVTFDSDADNSYQGMSSFFDLNFQANQ